MSAQRHTWIQTSIPKSRWGASDDCFDFSSSVDRHGYLFEGLVVIYSRSLFAHPSLRHNFPSMVKRHHFTWSDSRLLEIVDIYYNNGKDLFSSVRSLVQQHARSLRTPSLDRTVARLL